MNKMIIGVVAAVVVLAGGGWYILTNKTTSPATSDSLSPTTMNELLSSAVSLECTFSEANEQSQTSGTIFVADGKVRADMATRIPSISNDGIGSHLITDGKKVWVWSEAMPQGIEMAVGPINTGATSDPNQIDLDKKVNYSCKPWAKDKTKFDRPTNIQFMALPTAAAAQ